MTYQNGYYISDGELFYVNDQSGTERNYIKATTGAKVCFMQNPGANLYVYAYLDSTFTLELYHTVDGQITFENDGLPGQAVIRGQTKNYLYSYWYNPLPIAAPGLVTHTYTGDPASAAMRILFSTYDAESFKAGLALGRLLWRPTKTMPGWCRKDALVVRAGTVLSTNNGYRTPMTKLYDGEAAAFLAFNCTGSQYPDNWFGLFTVSPFSAEAAATWMNQGVISGTFTYHARLYYYSGAYTCRSWGGSTRYTNPLNLPEMTNVYLVTDVNRGDGIVSDFGEIVGNFLGLR